MQGIGTPVNMTKATPSALSSRPILDSVIGTFGTAALIAQCAPELVARNLEEFNVLHVQRGAFCLKNVQMLHSAIFRAPISWRTLPTLEVFEFERFGDNRPRSTLRASVVARRSSPHRRG